MNQRSQAPWPIPRTATTTKEIKNGYRQVKYTWNRGPWRYEARWHSQVPTAQFITYPSWRLDRVKPGRGYGPAATARIAQTWVAEKWLSTRRVRYLTSQANSKPTPTAVALIRAAHPAATIKYFPGNFRKGGKYMNQIIELLNQQEVPYQLVDHPAVYTAAEADHYADGYDFARAKNLFLHNSRGFFLVMTRDDQRLNMHQLKQQLATTRLSFAKEAELVDQLGTYTGAVSPFNLINDQDNQVTLVISRQLIDTNPLVGCHPNDNTKTVILKFADLIKIVRQWGNPIKIINLAKE